MMECRSANPRYLELRSAVRIGAAHIVIGANPVIVRRPALLDRQKRHKRGERIEAERPVLREHEILANDLEGLAGLVTANKGIRITCDRDLKVIERESIIH